MLVVLQYWNCWLSWRYLTNVYLETVLPIIGEVCKNHQTCIDNPFINIYWILDKRPQVQLLCMERKERFEAQTSFSQRLDIQVSNQPPMLLRESFFGTNVQHWNSQSFISAPGCGESHSPSPRCQDARDELYSAGYYLADHDQAQRLWWVEEHRKVRCSATNGWLVVTGTMEFYHFP